MSVTRAHYARTRIRYIFGLVRYIFGVRRYLRSLNSNNCKSLTIFKAQNFDILIFFRNFAP